MATDKNGKAIELQDYDARVAVGVQVNELKDKLWVCIDGVCVLRVNSPVISLEGYEPIKKE